MLYYCLKSVVMALKNGVNARFCLDFSLRCPGFESPMVHQHMGEYLKKGAPCFFAVGAGIRTRKGLSVKKTRRWRVFSEEARGGCAASGRRRSRRKIPDGSPDWGEEGDAVSESIEYYLRCKPSKETLPALQK